jgi:tRNA splicing endonuclease
MDLFSETVQELVLLHEQQFLAAIDADATANRFDLLIHEANEKKQAAKYAYLRHLEDHGCSLKDAIVER